MKPEYGLAWWMSSTKVKYTLRGKIYYALYAAFIIGTPFVIGYLVL